MRKFRFIGDSSTFYLWNEPPVVGKIYDKESFSLIRGGNDSDDVFDNYIESLTDEWQEVFSQDKPQNLHKDTDLGHFAGLAMAAIIKSGDLRFGSNAQEITFTAVNLAEELIKQLENEN